MTHTDIPVSDILIAEGTTVRLPGVTTSLTPKYVPNAGKVEYLAHQWAYPYLVQLLDAHEVIRSLSDRNPMYTTACYPSADAEAAQYSANLMPQTTLLDDQFCAPEAIKDPEVATAWSRVYHDLLLRDVAPPAGALVETMLYDLVPAMKELMPPTLRTRWTQAYLDIVDSFIVEANVRAGTCVQDFDTYLAHRLTSYYGRWCAGPHLEFNCGIDLTDALHDNAGLDEARDQAIAYASMVNDLFSFWKEYCAGDMVNAVWVLMRDGHDLQSAVIRLFEFMDATEERFHRACRDVLAGPLGDRADVRTYLTGLGDYMAGNREFHWWSQRYFTEGPYWDFTTPVTVTLAREPFPRMIFTPETHSPSAGS